MAPRFKSSVLSSVYDAVHEHATFDDESIEPDLIKVLSALDEDLFASGYEPADQVEKAVADLDVTMTEVTDDEEAEDEAEDAESESDTLTAGGDGETPSKDF